MFHQKIGENPQNFLVLGNFGKKNDATNGFNKLMNKKEKIIKVKEKLALIPNKKIKIKPVYLYIDS